MDLQEFEKIIPNVQHAGLTWITPNSHLAWRVETLLTKETDTIEWINTMQPGEVLFDIGANMGGYSLLAAQRGVRVHAFEPEAQNFAILVRNIVINNLSELVVPWPIALDDHPSLQVLHLSSLTAGGSCHSYGDSLNYNGEPKAFPYKQGSCATTLEAFCSKYGTPEYIKVDVDGFEHRVMNGISDSTLKNVRSVLIETNDHYPEHFAMNERMQALGFTFDQAQVDAALRTEGPFKGVGNVIWSRA